MKTGRLRLLNLLLIAALAFSMVAFVQPAQAVSPTSSSARCTVAAEYRRTDASSRTTSSNYTTAALPGRRDRLVGAICVSHWHNLAGKTVLSGVIQPGQVLPGSRGSWHRWYRRLADTQRYWLYCYGGRRRKSGPCQQFDNTRRGVPHRCCWCYRFRTVMAAPPTATKVLRPTGTLNNMTAALRKSNGATDTDNNSADFTVGAPNPRNTPPPDAAPSVASTVPAMAPPAWRSIATCRLPLRNASTSRCMVYTFLLPQRPPCATVSGGPTTFTLDPGTNFVDGDDLHPDRPRRPSYRPG